MDTVTAYNAIRQQLGTNCHCRQNLVSPKKHLPHGLLGALLLVHSSWDWRNLGLFYTKTEKQDFVSIVDMFIHFIRAETIN